MPNTRKLVSTNKGCGASGSRRRFLGALSLTPFLTGRPDARGVSLWCDALGLTVPEREANRTKVLAFVDRCAAHGVRRLFAKNGARILVDAARERDIDVHPYLTINDHGDALHVSDFAQAHPEFRSLGRYRKLDPEPGERVSLSLAHREVREHEVGRFAALGERSGGDSLQAELLIGNQDEDGAPTGGYEPAMVEAFKVQFGISPYDVSNREMRWTQFRADYYTRLLREMRFALSETRFTASFLHRPRAGYLRALLDWPRWVDDGLVDEVHVRFEATATIDTVQEHTEQAAEILAGRLPLIVALSCDTAGDFQTAETIKAAAKRARASGANEIAVYDSGAVDRLGLWPVLGEISEL